MKVNCIKCGMEIHSYKGNNKCGVCLFDRKPGKPGRCPPSKRKLWIRPNPSPIANPKKKLPEWWGRYRALKNRVKKKRFSYLMPFQSYIALIQKPCFYCGQDTWGKEKGIGLDRIDNSQEYTENNVVPCCGICNIAKGELSMLAFLTHIAKILSRHNT